MYSVRRMYKYTKFKINSIIARDQKRDEHSASFKSSPKISHTLITRLI